MSKEFWCYLAELSQFTFQKLLNSTSTKFRLFIFNLKNIGLTKNLSEKKVHLFVFYNAVFLKAVLANFKILACFSNDSITTRLRAPV